MRTDRHSRRHGFSLIELLVVTAITGIAIGSIVACFAAGLRVWEFIRLAGLTDGSLALASLELERDLGNAVFFGETVPFEGGPNGMSFAAHPAHGLAADGTPAALRVIAYRRNADAGLLLKREGTFPDQPEGPGEIALAEGVAAFALQYESPDAGGWSDRWTHATGMPRRVRFTLVCTSRLDRVESRQTVQLRAHAPGGTGTP